MFDFCQNISYTSQKRILDARTELFEQYMLTIASLQLLLNHISRSPENVHKAWLQQKIIYFAHDFLESDVLLLCALAHIFYFHMCKNVILVHKQQLCAITSIIFNILPFKWFTNMARNNITHIRRRFRTYFKLANIACKCKQYLMADDTGLVGEVG
ncbi:Hypothetical_protein [Hexamita inflata]|uniref:Hypothetical_protein n=1 Tax=Hexamita inflata TaxID=28002 RepID=A0AA86RCE5_9EUKA|nr:Hypothetical protein HINF_LOCUS63303 [Hexamita inflata]CAI9975659.1 Hypothetical protein HINF_LOCUS63304 [Hexamita inflata]